MWLIVLICAPLVLSLVDRARDLYCDAAMIRTVALRSEMGQMRSATIRRAGRLEALIEFHAAPGTANGRTDWESLGKEPWLQAQWQSVGEPAPHQLYSAVVSNAGIIVLHTRDDAVGKRLTSEWDDHKIPEAGGDVVRCPPSTLSGDAAAFDVHVPLVAAGRQLGTYHAGLDATWFDREVAAQQRELVMARSWTFGLLVAAIGGAVVGLVLLTRDFAEVRRQLAHEVQERARQLAQIGMGLAHEIRNPLHTLRINLHTLKRSLGRTPLNEQDLNDMVRESDAEIDHVDALVRDFVQYTVPQGGEPVDIDLGREIQATVNLLGEEWRRNEVEVHTQTAQQPVVVHMEPARLRQIALSLLTFAQNSAGPKGVVQIDVQEHNGRAQLTIADSGPALSGTESARLFEPFQGTSHAPAGLGLALVQRFVDEAGGRIDRRRQSAVGGCFFVSLPLANHHSQGT